MNFDSILAIIEHSPKCYGSQEVRDLDKFTWFMKLLGDDEKGRTRVAIARKDGMLIKHNPAKLERFRMVRPFEMFICVDGKRGSELLKRLENPKHDDFELTVSKTHKKKKKQKKNTKD